MSTDAFLAETSICKHETPKLGSREALVQVTSKPTVDAKSWPIWHRSAVSASTVDGATSPVAKASSRS